MRKRLYGSVVSLLLSAVVLLLLYGEVFRSPGSFFFSSNRVGFTPYYSALFHTRHDATAFQSSAMNYPYGEEISFTDAPALITIPLQFISRNLTDISESAIAVINLSVLISIIIGALFLFLILAELGVVWWYAAPAAAGIAMLSPQTGNFAGTLALSWVFWMPLLVWLFIRFERSRNIFYTLGIGLATFAAGLLHVYYIAIFLIITGGYWFIRFYWYRRERTFWYRDIHHIFLQFILPVLFLQFLTLIHTDVADRPAWPEGLFSLLARPQDLLFSPNPAWVSMGRLWNAESQGVIIAPAYLGTPAIMGLMVAIALGIRRVIKRSPVFSVTEDVTVNVAFWVSLLALLFSFGLPMKLGLHAIADFISPLRQLRDLSRFAWLFYYLFNIVLFTALYYKAFSPEKHWYRKVIALAALALLLTEAFFYQRSHSGKVIQRVDNLYENYYSMELENWINETDLSAYQAIASVPFYHTGSENLRMEGSPEVKPAAQLLSLHTGLPTLSADLNRTSIAQTYTIFALYTDPLQRLEFPDFLPDERPLLLMVMNNYTPDEVSERLIEYSKQLLSTSIYSLYELPVQTIRRLNLIYQERLTELYQSQILTQNQEWLINNPAGYYFINGFDDLPHSEALEGEGMLTFASRKEQVIWQDTLTSVAASTKFSVSFWMKDYRTDAQMRTLLSMKLLKDGETTAEYEAPVYLHIKAFSGEWALIEFPFTTTHPENEVIITLQNSVRPGVELGIDQLMVREEGTDLFRQSGRWLEMNNRRVIIRRQL